MSGSALSADLFVSGSAIERQVEINGTKQTLWFREVSQADWYRYVSLRGSDNVDTAAGARAFLISRSLCEPDGTLALTIERAAELKLRVSRSIEQEIMVLDGIARDTAGNESAPGADDAGSGTS